MVNKRQTLGNRRKTTENMDNDATRAQAHNSEIVRPVFTGHRHSHKVRCTFDFQKRITREAAKPIRISWLSNKNDKNGKNENAERSEPNIGQIPGRAGPASVQSSNVAGLDYAGLALFVSAIYLQCKSRT